MSLLRFVSYASIGMHREGQLFDLVNLFLKPGLFPVGCSDLREPVVLNCQVVVKISAVQDFFFRGGWEGQNCFREALWTLWTGLISSYVIRFAPFFGNGQWTWSANFGYSANRSLLAGTLTELLNFAWRKNDTISTFLKCKRWLKKKNEMRLHVPFVLHSSFTVTRLLVWRIWLCFSLFSPALINPRRRGGGGRDPFHLYFDSWKTKRDIIAKLVCPFLY